MRPATLALATLVLGATACAHAQPRPVAELAARGRCEEAAAWAARHPVRPPPGAGLRRGARTAAAVVSTAAGYTFDVAFTVAGAALASAAVCAPVFALEAALGGDGGIGHDCMEDVAQSLLDDGLFTNVGRSTWNGTRRWRCPDLRPLVGEARAIAACHASRGEVDLARERLLTLAASRAWACVPSRDRRSVLADLDAWALP